MSVYRKEDVIPRMKGLWVDMFQSMCNLPSSVFNKKHQPCPSCGGKDRFRWTDNLDSPGDGGAICNMCGADSGIGWLMKLTGMTYFEAVNALGEFVGGVPMEVRIRANKRASKQSGYNFGAQVDHEKCVDVMSRTELVYSTPLSVYEGISTPGDEMYSVGVKKLEDGAEELIHTIPCHLVHDDGVDDEMCNLMFISEIGCTTFLAKDYTRGSVAVTGSTDKTIYLCTDWIDAQHVHLSTGQEVWTCFTPSNLEIVAYRYKGNRNMRVVCKKADRDTIISAEERGLDVLIPAFGDNFKFGVERKLYKPSSLL